MIFSRVVLCGIFPRIKLLELPFFCGKNAICVASSPPPKKTGEYDKDDVFVYNISRYHGPGHHHKWRRRKKSGGKQWLRISSELNFWILKLMNFEFGYSGPRHMCFVETQHTHRSASHHTTPHVERSEPVVAPSPSKRSKWSCF